MGGAAPLEGELGPVGAAAGPVGAEAPWGLGAVMDPAVGEAAAEEIPKAGAMTPGGRSPLPRTRRPKMRMTTMCVPMYMMRPQVSGGIL